MLWNDSQSVGNRPNFIITSVSTVASFGYLDGQDRSNGAALVEPSGRAIIHGHLGQARTGPGMQPKARDAVSTRRRRAIEGPGSVLRQP